MKNIIIFVVSIFFLQGCVQVHKSSQEYRRVGRFREIDINGFEYNTKNIIPVDFTEGTSEKQKNDIEKWLLKEASILKNEFEKETSQYTFSVEPILRTSRCTFESGVSNTYLIYRATCFSDLSYRDIVLIETSGQAIIKERHKADLKGSESQHSSKLKKQYIKDSLKAAVQSSMQQVYKWNNYCTSEKKSEFFKKPKKCSDLNRLFLLKYWQENKTKFSNNQLSEMQQIEMLSEMIEFGKIADLDYLENWEETVSDRVLIVLFKVYHEISSKKCDFYLSSVLIKRINKSLSRISLEKLRDKELRRCLILQNLI